jgi:hypothetical protein
VFSGWLGLTFLFFLFCFFFFFHSSTHFFFFFFFVFVFVFSPSPPSLLARSLISWRGRDYEVKDVRFHSPSEHSVRGTKFPLEAQIGTLGENGRRLFLSVMFTEGEKSAVLGKFWGKFPTTRDVVSVGKGSLNVKDIVPDKGQYYLYRGSDSRPPCDPATWIVFKDPLEVSEEQVRDFVLRAGEPTSRPIQPSGDRTVRISAPTPETEDLLPKGTLTIKPVEAPVVAK